MGANHVLVQEALLLERFSEVALELFVIGDSAGVGVGRGDVLGHVGDVILVVVRREDCRKSVYST